MTIKGFVSNFGSGSFSSLNLARLAVNNLDGDIKIQASKLLESEAVFMGSLLDNGWPNEKVNEYTLTVLSNYKNQLTNYSEGF